VKLTSRRALEDALRADVYLLFKHSERCGASVRAFRQYEAFLAEHAIPTGWIDVVADRRLAQWVADATGVTHESPQALLLRKGSVAWHASHFEITRDSLAAALR
jgi:bacillithiol system protein YtxJ